MVIIALKSTNFQPIVYFPRHDFENYSFKKYKQNNFFCVQGSAGKTEWANKKSGESKRLVFTYSFLRFENLDWKCSFKEWLDIAYVSVLGKTFDGVITFLSKPCCGWVYTSACITYIWKTHDSFDFGISDTICGVLLNND